METLSNFFVISFSNCHFTFIIRNITNNAGNVTFYTVFVGTCYYINELIKYSSLHVIYIKNSHEYLLIYCGHIDNFLKTKILQNNITRQYRILENSSHFSNSYLNAFSSAHNYK